MAPLPDNNTPVLFIDYTSVGQRHTAQVRLPSSATTSDAATAYAIIAATVDNITYTSDTILGARFRAAGGNVSFPLAVSPVTGTLAGTADPDYKPNFMSFTGRSADGRDARFTWYTSYVTPVTDGYRDATPNSNFAGILAALGSAGADARSISGQAVIWNPYVNFGVNAYFQRKARRS